MLQSVWKISPNSDRIHTTELKSSKKKLHKNMPIRLFSKSVCLVWGLKDAHKCLPTDLWDDVCFSCVYFGSRKYKGVGKGKNFEENLSIFNIYIYVYICMYIYNIFIEFRSMNLLLWFKMQLEEWTEQLLSCVMVITWQLVCKF